MTSREALDMATTTREGRQARARHGSGSRLAMLFAGLVALGTTGAVRGYIFEPPYTGLRVRVERFDTAGFPRVDMFMRLESGDKQDFRYLHQANLRLTEEEVEIKDFDVQLESPAVSLALVLDDSGSIDPDLEYLRLAATRFVDELHRVDEVAVVSFDRGARVLQERTTRKDLMKEAIGKLRAYGATAVFDGALLGIDSVLSGKGQRKMLLLTDGNDQVYPGGKPLSVETEAGLVARAKAEGVEIYTIALGQHADRALLERIAQKTGGQAWYAPHPRHLREVFDAIVRSMSAQYRVSYVSPNARREKLDRTLAVDVFYQHHLGRGIGTYWLDREVPVTPLEVERKLVAGKGPGKVRIYTQGFRGQFLLCEFTLKDKDGRIYRTGRTTVDGFGRLDTPDPLLAAVKPGTYTLVVKIPDQPLGFTVRDLEVHPGETTSRRIAFSRLVFTRAGDPWYELQHPYGATSELLKVTIRDALASEKDGDQPNREVFSGRLSDLRHHREVGLWLPEGVYDIGLENLWKDEDPAEKHGESAPLVNALSARFQVLGGQELRFDVQKGDLAGEEDVLSEEYLRDHPDENPFVALRPETRLELDAAVAARRDRYLAGEFTRHERGNLVSETGMYRYRNPDEVAARLAELENRYQGPEPAGDEIPVDAHYLQAHGLGPQARQERLREIKDHYLSGALGSFPDRAGASPAYTGGPGDRFEGVEDLRLAHDRSGGAPRDPETTTRLWDLREKVRLGRAPAGPDAMRPEGGVDPTDPQGPGDLAGLAARVRARLSGSEYGDSCADCEPAATPGSTRLAPEPVVPEKLHNLDSKRRAGKAKSKSK